jgi:phosphoglycolate phosphatase-like HAD superfamily hydrolase
MKSLIQYIKESLLLERIKQLPASVKGLIVFDIDDTLLKVDTDVLKIYKNVPGKPEQALTTEEFAKDPDAADPNKKSLFDFRDFQDPIKVYQSIISGTPLIKNLRIMDDYIEAGYDFCFLTARGCEETIKTALDEFLRVRNRDNNTLRKLGDTFKKTLSHAINDMTKNYPGRSDAEKKSNVLKYLCKKYDRVVFVDDDTKNVNSARNLRIPNLRVIKAWEN